MLSDTVSYFRACYQADNRALHLYNFFSSKVEHRLMLSDAELISGSLPKVAVAAEWATDAQKDLAIYTKEKALYCCSLFVLGHTQVAQKKRRFCAPLYLHAAQLNEKDDEFYVRINTQQTIINPAAIKAVSDADTYDQLAEQLPTGFIDFGLCGDVQRLLHNTLPTLDTQELLLFPQLYSEEAIKQCYKKLAQSDAYSLVPAAGLCVVRKSNTTLGVLSELKEMSQTNTWSPPLRALFSRTIPPDSPPSTTAMVPVALSQAQEKVLASSHTHVQTLVIGPPGTGKSFTIAALAVDYLSQGKSVLIASNNNQAVDVIADKIEKDFKLPDVIVRGGQSDYKKVLKKRLQDMLSGINIEDVRPDILEKYEKTVTNLTETICQLEAEITEREQKELRRGVWLSQRKSGWFTQWRKMYVRWRTANTDSYHTLLEQLENTQQQREKVIRKYLVLKFQSQLATSLRLHRSTFKSFLQALRARTAQRKESLFESADLSQLQRAFPIWLTNLSDVSSLLPLQQELFDVVILDEATQCDIASTLPVLQRAKRSVIVGDPQQLRHVSFLSEARQRHLKQQYGLTEAAYGTLNFRTHSLLDKVQESIQEQSQSIFLNEHYRSAPSIISFSNQKFYQGALRIMQATPQANLQQRVAVHPGEGSRDEAGHNPTEADAIIAHVRQLINDESRQTAVSCQSVGILSPFREQVDYLQKKIQTVCTLNEIERHQILVGTAHSFQGEERDTMFISFVLSADAHPTAFRYLNQPDVFNVSITRARSQQHIFVSLPATQLKPDSLLRQYLEVIAAQAEAVVSPPSGKDIFLDEITATLNERGVADIHRAYPIAGIEIDLLVTHAGETYCVDAIGYPGDFAEGFSLERYKILHRVGLTTFPVAYSSWCLHRTRAVNELTTFLQLG